MLYDLLFFVILIVVICATIFIVLILLDIEIPEKLIPKCFKKLEVKEAKFLFKEKGYSFYEIETNMDNERQIYFTKHDCISDLISLKGVRLEPNESRSNIWIVKDKIEASQAEDVYLSYTGKHVGLKELG